jgi:hypothetical protein
MDVSKLEMEDLKELEMLVEKKTNISAIKKKLKEKYPDLTDEKLEKIIESLLSGKDSGMELKHLSDEFKNDRPPKGWWDRCVESVSDVTDTPERLCGWIYFHQMGPKAEAEETRQ